MSLQAYAITKAQADALVRARHKNLQDTYPGILPDFDDLPADVQAIAHDRLLFDPTLMVDGHIRKAPKPAPASNYRRTVTPLTDT